jgi:plasmid stability protein
MLNLTLKNIPKELHARLRESAEKNRRSLNSEILARLEAECAAPVVDAAAEIRPLRAFVARLPKADHAKVARYKRQGRPVAVHFSGCPGAPTAAKNALYLPTRSWRNCK